VRERLGSLPGEVLPVRQVVDEDLVRDLVPPLEHRHVRAPCRAARPALGWSVRRGVLEGTAGKAEIAGCSFYWLLLAIPVEQELLLATPS
jgi:hypothetical protein